MSPWRARDAAIALLGTVILLASGCERPASTGGSEAGGKGRDGKPVVFVTLAPQRYFVERIAGERFDIRVLVGPGSSEHQYDPTPQQMVVLAEASAYFRLGVTSETRVVAQLQQAAPKLKIVDTRDGIDLRSMTADEGQCDHDHDDHDHDHAQGAKDPHIWLDPILVKTQASTIAATLKAIDAADGAMFDRNLASFVADLDAIHAKIQTKLAPFREREFLVYHPAYGYFADRYGLRQVAVETEGKEPTPKALNQLVERAKKSGTRTIFYQPQFSVGPAKTLASAIGGQAIPLDPLSADYLKNLESMADAIAAAFSNASSPIVETAPAAQPGARP